MEFLQHVETDLRQLAAQAKKKFPIVCDAAETAIARIRSLREEYARAIRALGGNGTPPASLFQAEEVIRPYLLLCNHAEAPSKLVCTALTGVQYMLNRDAVAPGDVANLLRVLTIQAGRQDAAGRAAVQLRVLQTVLVAAAPPREVSEETLQQALGLCILLLRQDGHHGDAAVLTAAAAALGQLLSMLFDQVSVPRRTDPSPERFTAAAGAVPPEELLRVPEDAPAAEKTAFRFTRDVCRILNGDAAQWLRQGTHHPRGAAGGNGAGEAHPVPVPIGLQVLQELLTQKQRVFRGHPMFAAVLRVLLVPMVLGALQRAQAQGVSLGFLAACELFKLVGILARDYFFPQLDSEANAGSAYAAATHQLHGMNENARAVLLLSLHFVRAPPSPASLAHPVHFASTPQAAAKASGDAGGPSGPAASLPLRAVGAALNFWDSARSSANARFGMGPNASAPLAPPTEAAIFAGGLGEGWAAKPGSRLASDAGTLSLLAVECFYTIFRVPRILCALHLHRELDPGEAPGVDAARAARDFPCAAAEFETRGRGEMPELRSRPPEGLFSSRSTSVLLATVDTLLEYLESFVHGGSLSPLDEASEAMVRILSSDAAAARPLAHQTLLTPTTENESGIAVHSGEGPGVPPATRSDAAARALLAAAELSRSLFRLFEDAFGSSLAENGEPLLPQHLKLSVLPEEDAAGDPDHADVAAWTVAELVALTWQPMLRACSMVLMTATSPVVLHVAVTVLERYLTMAAVLRLEAGLRAIVETLCKLSVPLWHDPDPHGHGAPGPADPSGSAGEGDGPGDIGLQLDTEGVARPHAERLLAVANQQMNGEGCLLGWKHRRVCRSLLSALHVTLNLLPEDCCAVALDAMEQLHELLGPPSEIQSRPRVEGLDPLGKLGVALERDLLGSEEEPRFAAPPGSPAHAAALLPDLGAQLAACGGPCRPAALRLALHKFPCFSALLADAAVAQLLAGAAGLGLQALATYATRTTGGAAPGDPSYDTASASSLEVRVGPAAAAGVPYSLLAVLRLALANGYRFPLIWDAVAEHLCLVAKSREPAARAFGIKALYEVSVLAIKACCAEATSLGRWRDPRKPPGLPSGNAKLSETMAAPYGGHGLFARLCAGPTAPSAPGKGFRPDALLLACYTLTQTPGALRPPALDPQPPRDHAFVGRVLRSLQQCAGSPFADARVGVLTGLHHVLEACGHLLKGHWRIVFGLLRSVAESANASEAPADAGREVGDHEGEEAHGNGVGGHGDRDAGDGNGESDAPKERSPLSSWGTDALEYGFECLQLIVDDFLEEIDVALLGDLIRCAGLYASQKQDVNVSLAAIGMVRRISDVVSGIRGAASNADAASGGLQVWLMMLQELQRLSGDPRAELRSCAVKTLFNALVDHGRSFSEAQWETCFETLVFPLFAPAATPRAGTKFAFAGTPFQDAESSPKLAAKKSGAALAKGAKGGSASMPAGEMAAAMAHAMATSTQDKDTLILALQGLGRLLRTYAADLSSWIGFADVWARAVAVAVAAVLRANHTPPETAGGGSRRGKAKADLPLAGVDLLLTMLQLASAAGLSRVVVRAGTGMKVVDGALERSDGTAVKAAPPGVGKEMQHRAELFGQTWAALLELGSDLRPEEPDSEVTAAVLSRVKAAIASGMEVEVQEGQGFLEDLVGLVDGLLCPSGTAQSGTRFAPSVTQAQRVGLSLLEEALQRGNGGLEASVGWRRALRVLSRWASAGVRVAYATGQRAPPAREASSPLEWGPTDGVESEAGSDIHWNGGAGAPRKSGDGFAATDDPCPLLLSFAFAEQAAGKLATLGAIAPAEAFLEVAELTDILTSTCARALALDGLELTASEWWGPQAVMPPLPVGQAGRSAPADAIPASEGTRTSASHANGLVCGANKAARLLLQLLGPEEHVHASLATALGRGDDGAVTAEAETMTALVNAVDTVAICWLAGVRGGVAGLVTPFAVALQKALQHRLRQTPAEVVIPAPEDASQSPRTTSRLSQFKLSPRIAMAKLRQPGAGGGSSRILDSPSSGGEMEMEPEEVPPLAEPDPLEEASLHAAVLASAEDPLGTLLQKVQDVILPGTGEPQFGSNAARETAEEAHLHTPLTAPPHPASGVWIDLIARVGCRAFETALLITVPRPDGGAAEDAALEGGVALLKVSGQCARQLLSICSAEPPEGSAYEAAAGRAVRRALQRAMVLVRHALRCLVLWQATAARIYRHAGERRETAVDESAAGNLLCSHVEAMLTMASNVTAAKGFLPLLEPARPGPAAAPAEGKEPEAARQGGLFASLLRRTPATPGATAPRTGGELELGVEVPALRGLRHAHLVSIYGLLFEVVRHGSSRLKASAGSLLGELPVLDIFALLSAENQRLTVALAEAEGRVETLESKVVGLDGVGMPF